MSTFKYIANFVEGFKSNDWNLKTSEGVDFPTRKTEYYKYTSLKKLSTQRFASISSKVDARKVFEGLDDYATVLVFVNGFFDASQSKGLTDQVSVVSKLDSCPAFLTSQKNVDQLFTSMNNRFATDGLVIDLKGVLKQEVLVLNILDASGMASFTKNSIRLDKNAQCSVVYKTISTGQNLEQFSNNYFEIELSDNAILWFYNLQNGTKALNLIEQVESHLSAGANLHYFCISKAGKLVRNNINNKITAPSAEVNLYGIMLGEQGSHIDHHTLVDHDTPHTQSNEIYKIINKEASTSVFNGKVLVRPDAQKTNAYQSSSAILLDDASNVYAKPELEIYADDVKCSHGSTTGQIDKEALFYLQARGLSKTTAKKMLIEAFLTEVTDLIESEKAGVLTSQMIQEYFS